MERRARASNRRRAGGDVGARANQVVVRPVGGEARVVVCGDEPGPHVRRRTRLGSDAGPVATTADLVVVGTHSKGHDAARWPGDGGVMACFQARDGAPLWYSFHPRLPARVNDIPESPIRSLAWIEDDGVYFVSNRGELVCADPRGFHDGEDDGPLTDQPLRGATDVDVKWSLDMPRELGVYKVDASDVGNPLPAPIVSGEYVYCVTGNGAGWVAHGRGDVAGRGPMRPRAPSLVAVHRASGRRAWSDSSPSPALRYGQWTAPRAAAASGGRPAVVYAGGDAKLYALAADGGATLWASEIPGVPRLEWDQSADFPVAPPVVADGRAFIGLGTDWESHDRMGRSLCAFSTDDGRQLWEFTHRRFRGSFAAPVLIGDVLCLMSSSGGLFGIDPELGHLRWTLEELIEDPGRVYAAPVAGAGLLYLTVEDRVYVVSPSADSAPVLGWYEFTNDVEDAPAFCDGTLYVASGGYLWAVQGWDALAR